MTIRNHPRVLRSSSRKRRKEKLKRKVEVSENVFLNLTNQPNLDEGSKSKVSGKDDHKTSSDKNEKKEESITDEEEAGEQKSKQNNE